MSSRSSTTTDLSSHFANNAHLQSVSQSTDKRVFHSSPVADDSVVYDYVVYDRAGSDRESLLVDDGLYIKQPYLGFLLLLVLVLAAGLRFYELGVESYSYDEGIMIEATSSGWNTVVENISRGRPPLIVLLGFGWITLFGESEFAVRLLPALMGILSVGLIFLIGQKLKNDAVGLVAAFIMATSAFHLFHSQDYRYYSLLTLMTLISFYFYVACFYNRLENSHAQGSREPGVAERGILEQSVPSWSSIALYVLFSAAVYYTHYQGVFVVVAQGLFFLLMWFRASNSLRWRWLLSQVVLGLLLIPSVLDVLLDMVAGSQDGDFQGTVGALGNLGPLSDPPIWLPFHTLFIKFYFLSIGNLLQWPYLLAAIVLIGIGIALASGRRAKSGQAGRVQWMQIRSVLTPSSPRLLILLGLWVLCPIFIPYILSEVLSPMYLPRYTIGALPAACLLLALLLVALRQLLPLWASLGALVILALPGLTTYYSADFKDQWRIAAEYLQEQSQLEEQLVDDETIAFISVNNETADRIQQLFGRYLEPAIPPSQDSKDSPDAPENAMAQAESACVISAGLATPDELVFQIGDCFSNETRVWMVTRTAKEGPQQQIEASVLASVPPGWRIANERHFSGVVVRLYQEN